MQRLITSSAIAFLLLACSGSDDNQVPADFSGSYSVAVTNTSNECQYDNWTIGNSTQNIPFEITQSGDVASGDLKGLANFYFAVLGIGTLSGPVTGSTASLSAVGTTSVKKGQCAYFVRATIALSLTGNTINGTVSYTNETNKHADCGVLEACSSVQSVAGSRPPK